MGATNKGAVSKLVKAWEAKNNERTKRAAGLGLMAVSLAACGGSDDSDDGDDGTDTTPVSMSVDLTIGQDLVEAGTDTGEGDDTITGAMLQGNGGAVDQSFEDADEIDGGDGDDTLTVTIDTNVAATVSNVETIVVRALAAVTVDMSSFDDSVDTIQVRNTAAGDNVTITAVQSAAAIVLSDVAANVSVTYDDDVLGSDAATASVTVDGFAGTLTLGVGAAADTDDSIATLDIAVESDSTVALTQAGKTDTIETISISGSGDITITEGATSFDSITEVDASGLAGGLTMALTAAAAAVTFTGGSGDDVVTASGDDDVISTGAGDDTITMAAGDLTIDAGAGDDTVAFVGLTADDTVDGGAGTNTASLDADDLDLLRTAIVTDENVTNFTIAAITGGLAAGVDFDFDAEDTGIDTVDLTVAAGAAGDNLTLSNFNGGTIQFGADQTGGIIVSSVGATDSVTLVMDEGAGATHTNVSVSGVETVAIVTDSALDDVVFTAIDLTGTTSLSISGAGNVTFTAETTTALETVDLSDATGTINIGIDNDAVTVIVGDLGDGSIIELGAGDRNTIEFGAEISNEISIVGFDAGNTLSDDVIDLSALGIDFADLDIVDGTVANGAGVGNLLITSDAFDGSIILDGVTLATIDATQFVM